MTLHLDQHSMNRRLGAYQSQTVETASPAKLISLLYEGAMKSIGQARVAIETSSVQTAHEHLLRAQSIVTELSASLNMVEGGELAGRLAALYDYCNAQLVEANVRKDVAPLEAAETVLSTLQESWTEMTRTLFADD